MLGNWAVQQLVDRGRRGFGELGSLRWEVKIVYEKLCSSS
jgi:hypothetical protein